MRTFTWSMVLGAVVLMATACGEVHSAGDPPSEGPETGEVRAGQTSGETPRVDWVREFGTPTSGSSTAVDARGNVYVAGGVFGALSGFSNGVRNDGFVRK